MKIRSSLVVLICLVALLAAWLLWPRGSASSAKVAENNSGALAVTASPAVESTNTVAAEDTGKNSAAATNRLTYRLSNSPKASTAAGYQEFTHAPHAVILENALMDTDAKIDFSIPKHLKSQGDPGAYIVQARGNVDASFRSLLVSAGAQEISYIPNNALLVRLSAGAATALTGNPLVQAVLPYEPYYKVQASLLGRAVAEKPLLIGQVLTLGLFADNAEATVAQIEKMGGVVVARDRSPFGPVVRINPPADWIALAQLPGVQRIEPTHQRKPANDLTRVIMGVAVNTITTSNYLNLSGSNVVVEVNDTGVDATHPDLMQSSGAAPSRVTGFFLDSVVDPDGHGTHIAGIIAGNGFESTTVTNARGSINPGVVGQYRGKAPLAKLVSLGFLGANDTNFFVGDSELQEAPALTNALISNNSWVNDGVNEYDLSAASYDAAARDAVPGVTGPQPVLFVFAAGNQGAGDTGGQSGNADSIASPGTAKDVVTVGALEQFRNITNIVTALDGTSNAIWSARTDSSSQVADYSARGNVGVFTEGPYGRFKPDVIAPGSFVVSTRSTMWDTNAYYNVTNFNTATYRGIVVQTNGLLYGILPIPINTVAVKITVTPNAQSPAPFPNFPIYVSASGPPTTTVFDIQKNNSVSIPPDSGGAIADITSIANGQIEFAIGDGTNRSASFDLTTQVITTNDLGNQLAVEQFLNDTLCTGPQFYRYESGTSLAAAAVSGTLALMQDFFTNTLHLTPSPVLLKAMLINGARVTGSYKYAVTNTINLQGWGLVKLTNSIPLALTNPVAAANMPLFFVDQSPTNTVKTGDRRTYLVSVPTPAARSQTLRVTLAWTDPPGNPAAGVKLVNNLDLVITNLATGAVYYGNNFSPSANPPNSLPALTNGTAFTDNINNVENIYLSPTLSTNYSITVVGTAVNVNAVTLEQTNVVQDFALVVSSGDGNNTNGVTFTQAAPSFTPAIVPAITYLPATNGILFNQYAGANAPWLSTNTLSLTNTSYSFATNATLGIGLTNQWHFFIVTNTLVPSTNGPFKYAAFITFLPATLALPREGGYVSTEQNPTRTEADLELFVATSPDALAAQLTNIDSRVIANCLAGINGDGASIGRGGTEFVTYSNSTLNQVYYIAVQCQDQMAGQYAFVSIFTDTPFGSKNPDGSQNVYGKLAPAVIPDGNNAHAGVSYSLGLALFPMEIERVTVTNTVWHQNFGDLIGSLTHDQEFSILNNHNGFGFVHPLVRVYDDSGEGPTNNVFHTDSPGTLNNFDTKEGSGLWILNEIDDNLTQTGRVENFTVVIYPHIDLTSGGTITNVIPPMSWKYNYFYVPAGYTNMLVLSTNLPPDSTPPLQLYLNNDIRPTFTTFLLRTELTNGTPLGNSLSYGPPLAPGLYWIGVYNPDTVDHTNTLQVLLSYDASAALTLDYYSDGPLALRDDAVTTDSILVMNAQTIQDFNVGLRVDHSRISDLVFHLVSPAGVRYLLMENRGAQDTNGCGATSIATNFVNVNANGGPAAQTNYIDTHQIAGSIPINYDMFAVPDQMTIYYGSNNFAAGNLITNFFVNGAGLLTVTYPPPSAVGSSTFLTVVMNATNHPSRTRWTYNVGGVVTNNYYLAFTEDTNKTTTPIKFGPPPFIPTTNSSLVWTDSFEAYPLGTNLALGGWVRLATNTVIATNPPAFDGTNFLTLPNGGVISTNLPTLSGQRYQLSYQLGALPYQVFYAVNINDGTVQKFETNGVASTFSTNQINPSAVAVDVNGNVYVADVGTFPQSIERYTPTGVRSVFSVSTNFSDPFALAFDGAGNLYVANATSGSILKFTIPGGVETVFATGFNGPAALAFDAAGNLYVAENGANDIQKITPAGVVSFFAATGQNPRSLAFDPSGNLYVGNSTDNDVWSITPAGVSSVFATGFNFPLSLVFDSFTNLYIGDLSDTITEISSTLVTTTFATTGSDPVGLAYYNSNTDDPNNLGWQAQSLIFTAGPGGSPLVLNASNGTITVDGIVKNTFNFNATFDAFALTQLPSDLFYHPEQSLDEIINTSAFGEWQLEVLDNRAGATNNARLVDWRLEFVLARTNLAPAALGSLTSGSPKPGTLVAGGGYFGYYTVTVPGGATVATNLLLSATLPVNVWFATNDPANSTSASGTLLLAAVNGGTSVLTGTTTPPIVGGQTYYLVIENTNSAPVSFNVRVDFDSTSPSAALKFSGAKLSGTGKPQLQWLNTRGIGYKVQWSDTISPPVWHTINTPTVVTTNRVSTFIDNGSQTAPLGPQRYYRLLRVP